jgi:hypothetical protein
MSHSLARQARTALSSLALAWALTQGAYAQSFKLGHAELAQADGGTTTLFYPTLAAEAPVQKGPFELSWADDAPPAQGNRRLNRQIPPRCPTAAGGPAARRPPPRQSRG